MSDAADARADATTEALRTAWTAALVDFDLGELVRAVVEQSRTDRQPLRALAIGKAALSMLEGALDAGLSYAEAIVVVPDDLRDERRVVARASATSFMASHPIPDVRSEAAGRALLRLAERASPAGGTVHAFVSGGASALACVPFEGVDRSTKARVTQALLASGADVRAINTVRRHLSLLKGGGLLRAAAPTSVRTFVVSDVLGGAAHDVGAGPSVIDPTTVADARAVLARFAPEFASVPLTETTKASPNVAGDIEVVADATTFADHLCVRLSRAGFAARRDRAPLESGNGISVDLLASQVLAQAAQLVPGEAVIRCVEPALAVPTIAMRGGRATHVAATIASRLPEGVACLVGATDGVDGASGTGGAIVTARLSATLLARSIAAFDTGECLKALKASLPPGPTGLNFADVVVVARAR